MNLNDIELHLVNFVTAFYFLLREKRINRPIRLPSRNEARKGGTALHDRNREGVP